MATDHVGHLVPVNMQDWENPVPHVVAAAVVAANSDTPPQSAHNVGKIATLQIGL